MISKFINLQVKNSIQPYHWHDVMEINFILKGEVDIVLNNRKKHVCEGELLLLNRDDIHCIENATEDLLYLQIHFNMESFNQYIPEIWTVYFECGPDDQDIVSRELQQEIKIYLAEIFFLMTEKTKPDYINLVILYCVEILNNLKMGFDKGRKDASDDITAEQLARFWEVLDYMYDNCYRKLPLKEVAEKFYLNESYLSKLIKKGAGSSYEKFLGFIRAEASIRYLLNTDLSITNIAYECGFSAPRYFYAAFQRSYGCTPDEYRERNKNFFKLEKSRNLDHIVLEDTIARDKLLSLLSKYRKLSVAEEAAVNVQNIDVNISGAYNRVRRQLGKAQCINCTAMEVLDNQGLKNLESCRKELGINRIRMIDAPSKVKTIAENNLQNLGFEFVEDTDVIELNDLIGKSGICKKAFYFQKSLRDLGDEYCSLSKNCYISQQDGKVVIMTFNKEDRPVDLTLHISEFERDTEYLMMKTSFNSCGEGVEKFIENNIAELKTSIAELKEFNKPVYSFIKINAKAPVIEKINLGRDDFTVIKIYKVHNN